MAEFGPDQNQVLDRYNTAALRINVIAFVAGRLGVVGAAEVDVEALTVDQESWYRQLAEALLDMPAREELEAQKAGAETDLDETQILQRALFGPMTSPTLETGMLAGIIKNVTGHEPSSDALATEVLSRLRGLENHAATLQASIRRLGNAATYMADGGVNASLVTAERRAEIEAEVKEARRAALEDQTQRQAQEESVNRPLAGAQALIDARSFPMTIGELAEAIYGRVSDSTYVTASHMAANAAAGKGDLFRVLQAHGYKLIRVEVVNPNAGEGKPARKTLIAYEAVPADPEE